MELEQLRKRSESPSVGIFYQTQNKTLEKLFTKFKNQFVFSDSLDQYSFFLCDTYIVEDKSLVSIWSDFVEIKNFDEITGDESFLSMEQKKNSKHYSIRKSFLENFSFSPVDLYTSLNSGGKSHFRKAKHFGLYVPKDTFTDAMILSSDIGRLLRVCSYHLIKYSKENDIEKFLNLSSSVLRFCRENKIIEENPLYLYGINICIKKSLDTLVYNQNFSTGKFLTLIKSISDLERQMDAEVLLHCLMCIISDLGFSVSFSSLFLNVYFTDVRFSSINSRLELDEMVSLSSKNKELILNHAHEISSLLRKLKLGDETFLSAISQHHGSVTGKGFSDIFRSSIPKINIKFIAAQKLSQVFLELRPNEPMEHAVSNLKESVQFLPLKTEIEKLFNEHKKLFSDR